MSFVRWLARTLWVSRWHRLATASWVSFNGLARSDFLVVLVTVARLSQIETLRQMARFGSLGVFDMLAR